MRKRVCSLALCLTMALSLVTVPAWAEEEETAEDLAENPPVEESRAEAPEEEAPVLFTADGAGENRPDARNEYYTFEEVMGSVETSTYTLANGTKVSVKEIPAGDYQLGGALAMDVRLLVSGAVTLDLNGNTLSSTSGDVIVVGGESAALTVTDSGDGGAIQGRSGYNGIRVDSGATLNLNGGTVVTSGGSAGLITNGLDKANNVINIDGATVRNDDDDAIYMAGCGEINVKSGLVSGYSGVYMKAGTLTVHDGVVEGTGAYTAPAANGNGGGPTGDAVTMDTSAGYQGKIALIVKGGELSSTHGYAVHECATNAISTATINVDIKGGTFSGAAEKSAVLFDNWDSISSKSVTGGIFEVASAEALTELLALNISASTVKLTKNITGSFTVPAGSAVTLDLNGNTLTNAASAQDKTVADKDRKHTITNKGTLTLTGGGTVDNVSHGRAALYNSGTVTIDDVTLTRSAEKGSTPQDNGGNSWYVVYNNGTIEEITENAVVTSDSYYSSLICNCGTAAKPARIEKITGGAFSHNFVILKNDDYSYVGEISGGTFTVGAGAKETATILNFGTIGEISGGTFTNDGEWIVLRCSNWAGDPAIVGEATITGGTFTVADGGTVLLVNQGSTPGTAAPVLAVEGGKFTGKVEKRGDVGTLKVSGGSFSEAVPDACLAEGYAAVDTGAADYPFVIAKTYKAAFTVTPEGAKVEVKNGDAAVPANEDGTYTLNTAGTYTYSVSAEGYVTKTGAITAPAEGDTVTIEVALSTEPAKTAQVTFAVTPKDAKVEVKDAGGAAVEANADGTYTLNLGETYTYTVSASGYTAKDGKILPDKDSLTVTVELSKKTSGGGGGGGSSSSGTTTDTTTNKDGSTTTTVTDQKTGTVTETTKEKDGTVTTVETTKDGTVTETVKTPDGVTGAVVTEDGEVVKAAASVSASAAKEAAKSGEAVTLPLEVPAADSTKDAPAVTVSVPKSVDSVKVEVPVEKVTPGTVAVIVHADGTEEIVKTSVVTEAGVALVLEADATLKIVDNSKDFADVPASYWAADAVDYVASRELFNGTGADTFTPAAPMTRAMLMTVLARLDGADTSGEAFAKGMAWAVEKGVSDGTDPDGTISRQQLAVMLWRYAGAPAAEDTALDFTDAGAVADYAAEAMRWAVGSGILSGTADGALNPEGQATRAHVAAMLMRFNNAML